MSQIVKNNSFNFCSLCGENYPEFDGAHVCANYNFNLNPPKELVPSNLQQIALSRQLFENRLRKLWNPDDKLEVCEILQMLQQCDQFAVELT